MGFQEKGQIPTLFLHSCCAPCSSYCLEYLSEYFSITVFYYNPNIYPMEEYDDRIHEQERLIKELNEKEKMTLVVSTHDPFVYNQFERVIVLEDGKIKE